MLTIFRDDFAVTGIPWKVTAGTGVLTRTTTDGEFMTKCAAMKLTTSTVASEATEVHRYSGGIRRHPHIVFGGRFSIQDENISNMAFYLGYRDGTNWYRAKLLHTYSTNLWQYDAGGAGAQNLQTLLTRDPAEVSSRGMWHTFAIGAKFAPADYKHNVMIYDEQDFSSMVSGVALRQAADATVPNMLDFAVETTNLGGTPTAGVLLFDELWAVAVEEDFIYQGGSGDLYDMVLEHLDRDTTS